MHRVSDRKTKDDKRYQVLDNEINRFRKQFMGFSNAVTQTLDVG